VKKLIAVSLCLTACFAARNSLIAQSYLYETGSPQFSTQIPIENGFINVNNGDIHIEIPLATNAQRGHLKLNERLIYDSRIWKLVSNGGISWQPTNVPNSMGGWVFSSGVQAGTYSYSMISGTGECDGPANLFSWNNYFAFVWTDSQGTSHQFSDQARTLQRQSSLGPHCLSYTGPIVNIPTASGYANDGSGYFATISNFTSLTVYDQQGNQYNPTMLGQTPSLSAEAVDSNGNYWSQDPNGNLIDTVGRTPVKVSTSGNLIYYDVLGEGGVNQRYTVTTETVLYNTNFAQSGVTDTEGSFTAIQSIELPDGSTYAFTYDSGGVLGHYGDLTSVTLPTGGVIQYGFTNFLDSFGNQNRWIHTRLKDGGTTTFAPGTISLCTTTVGCQEKVVVTSPPDTVSPAGNDTVYTFTLDNGSYLQGGSWNTGIDVYQGPASGGAKLKSVSTAYTYTQQSFGVNEDGNSAGEDTVVGNYEIPASITTNTTVTNGLESQTIAALNFFGGQPTSIKEWNYYLSSGGAPSAPTRETDYVYAGLNGGTITVPSQITVKDGSGNQISQTSYSYDETTGAGHAALAPVSGLPQEPLAVSGSRGNLTTTLRWLNTTGATTSRTAAYDSAGAMLSSTDPNGTTSYGYDSADAFVTQITRPSTNGVQHVSSSTFDPSTGLITRSDDENSHAQGSTHPTTYAYESTLNRIQSITYPDSGQKTYSYPSPREVDTATLASPDPSISSQSISDSFGRQSQEVRAGVSSETSYDSNGRIFCITNPHLGSSSPTDGMTCTNRYDALGRPLAQTEQDGSTLSWSYGGNVSTSVNEAGNSWQRAYDVWGRLGSVVEPSGATTTYAYNALGNLTTITQNGVSGETPRIRGFVFDSLSRLTSETNPETGTISYGYDSNGNVTSRTDARGITTTLAYDALNRLTQKSYNDGVTSTAFYGYDSSSINFVPPSGSTNPRLTATLANTVGRLAFASGTSSNSLYAYSYDSMGRIVNQWVSTPSYITGTSTVLSAASTYDLAGNVKSITYPDGRTINQTWNASGQLMNITDASNSYQYLTSASYRPDGAPSALFLGNGVGNGYDKNSRLLINETGVTRLGAKAPGTYTNNVNLSVKEYCYGPNTAALSSTIPGCTNSAANPNGLPFTGSIWQIMDVLNPNATQNFNYDSLNRITFFQQSAQLASEGQNPQQTYAYDSFGNLNQNGGSLQDNATYAQTNRISNNGYSYDSAGNVTSYSTGVSPQPTLAYDAENRLTNVNSGIATYTYDAYGDRIRKDISPTWTEYVHFNGLPIAEKSSDGTWSDYIFANGQRIARADNYDIRIHMSGTNCSGCSNPNMFAGVNSLTAADTYTIRSGDVLSWRQYQDGSAMGGIILTFAGNTNASGTLDSDGQMINADTTTNSWHMRTVDLSAFAGKTVGGVFPYDWQTAPAGNWDIYYGDISLSSTDGTVIPIYNRTIMGLTPSAAAGVSNFSAVTEKVIGLSPIDTTYYSTDQIGSTNVLTDYAGWPVASAIYYPFGTEATTSFTDNNANHYKFTGQERDSEAQLDYFNARHYSYGAGRFMSADPYHGSFDLSNPQSLNRYSYVSNNPLSFTDPSGLDGDNPISVAGGLGGCVGAAASEGVNIVADIGCGISLFRDIASLFSPPSFTGTLQPRPSGTGAPNWDGNFGESNGLPVNGPVFGGGIGGALGIPSGGCEFGACGGGFTQGSGSTGVSLGTTFIVPPNLFSLFHFPFFDSSDPNHRLFGTHYCGPGGGGDTTGGLDGLCAAHDACYRRMGVSAIDNLNPFTSGSAMGGCDRLLCYSLQNFQPTSPQERSGKDHIQQVFGCGYILKQ
jgi:RHS repeat-associated protein